MTWSTSRSGTSISAAIRFAPTRASPHLRPFRLAVNLDIASECRFGRFSLAGPSVLGRVGWLVCRGLRGGFVGVLFGPVGRRVGLIRYIGPFFRGVFVGIHVVAHRTVSLLQMKVARLIYFLLKCGHLTNPDIPHYSASKSSFQATRRVYK